MTESEQMNLIQEFYDIIKNSPQLQKYMIRELSIIIARAVIEARNAIERKENEN